MNLGVEPMIWDKKVAAYAHECAEQRAKDCQLLHSGGSNGENLYWGYGDKNTLTTLVVT